MLKKKSKISTFSKALNYAYRLLAISQRSEKEIRKRLKEKGYDLESINEVVRDLKEKRLLDDTQFAREWIKRSLAFRPKGPLAIRDELLKKGLEQRLIDSILKDESTGYKEYEVARALVDKRLEALKGLGLIKRRKSIYNYLARRGFSFDIINDIIDTV